MDLLEFMMGFGSEKMMPFTIELDIIQKSNNTYAFSYNYAKIKIDSYDSSLIEQMLTLCDVITFVRADLNKYQNHYYYIFLEKCLCK